MYKVTVDLLTLKENEEGSYRDYNSREVYSQIVEDLDMKALVDTVNKEAK